jgi:predicted nucleotidyltransferase
LNPDFSDFIESLNKFQVEYLVIGEYAVIYHGYNRTTGDLDIWVNATEENYERLSESFRFFGMSTFDMTVEKFLNTELYDVFTFGRPPVCIDILTKVKGLDFKEAFRNSKTVVISSIELRMIDIRDLKTTKQEVNRPKDQDDLEHLP